MADVEGFDERDVGDGGIKNDFAYHNNVAGAAKHIRFVRWYDSEHALNLRLIVFPFKSEVEAPPQ